MTGATVRAPAVLATAMLLATACAGAGEGDRQPAEAKSRAEVEAEARAEVQALADLAGGPVTTWATRTRRCDIGDPGRSWAMDGTARIPLPADEHVATVRAVRTGGPAPAGTSATVASRRTNPCPAPSRDRSAPAIRAAGSTSR